MASCSAWSMRTKLQGFEIEALNDKLGTALHFQTLPDLVNGRLRIMHDHVPNAYHHPCACSIHSWGCASDQGQYKDASELAKFRALVLLPHDVTGFFWMEAYALAIPTFVPSPRLLAEWEAEYDMPMHIMRANT